MNLVALASHTVDLDLLPESPTVLDVGCRGFDFTREIFAARPDAFVVALDPSPDVQFMGDARIFVGTKFERLALVGLPRHIALLAMHSTGEGNCICEDDVPWYADAAAVKCTTMLQLMDQHGVKHWDLVKLDCEGSEFGILEHWPGPIAGQISVEFHDWTGPWEGYVKGDYYARLWAGPLKDYEVVSHDLKKVGSPEAWGHWDSLLRLR